MAGFAVANQGPRFCTTDQTNSAAPFAGWPPCSRRPLGPGPGRGAEAPKATPGPDPTVTGSPAAPVGSARPQRAAALAWAALGYGGPAAGLVAEKLGRLTGRPDPGHEVGFGRNGVKTDLL
jgi:hypothetical protein